LLTALAEQCGGKEKMNDLAVAIDKLDKTGIDKVKEELAQKGLTAAQISLTEQYLDIKGNNTEILQKLEKLIGETDNGKTGISDLNTIIESLSSLQLNIRIDPSLARGLNYYTGTIFEAIGPPEVKIGSIGGGGRYDDLTGLFGVPGIPGVGISFGVDRIYDLIEELNLFPAEVDISTQVLFFNLGENESKKAFTLVRQLRQKGIRCELFHEAAKFDKQFKYAEKKNIPWIIIIGEKELKENSCNVKRLSTGGQQTISMDKLVEFPF
jgi:histidyl-tRNA synthetase